MPEDTIEQETLSNPTAFVSALKDFLKQVESDPFDIDTSIFDRNRKQEQGLHRQRQDR